VCRFWHALTSHHCKKSIRCCLQLVLAAVPAHQLRSRARVAMPLLLGHNPLEATQASYVQVCGAAKWIASGEAGCQVGLALWSSVLSPG
jgi:hypothetical protein